MTKHIGMGIRLFLVLFIIAGIALVAWDRISNLTQSNQPCPGKTNRLQLATASSTNRNVGQGITTFLDAAKFYILGRNLAAWKLGTQPTTRERLQQKKLFTLSN